MLALFDHPEQWQRLVDDPGLARTAADEIVRWASPVNLFRRTATAETMLGGQKIAEDDKVVVFYSSANRDAAVFADPDVFDVGRDPNPHIGFGGGGAHFCLGNHLAKLELRILFEQLARRRPGLRQRGRPGGCGRTSSTGSRSCRPGGRASYGGDTRPSSPLPCDVAVGVGCARPPLAVRPERVTTWEFVRGH